jgi:glucose-6-phosphate dehydrogenase assembly protein OpcA
VEAAVSATAPEAGERSEWHGEDVDVDEVAEQLLRMNREHARHAHGHAATRTLTLLVAPGADAAPELVAARLEEMHARHPARTIVLREHAADRLDASLQIDCALAGGPGAAGHCHDAVVLRADAARLRHADSLVHALLVGGLPIVLWLPGARESPAEAALAALASAIVLDSGAAADAAVAGLARAARLGERCGVRDLAWLRLARWRQRVVARFDEPAARALLPRVERLQLHCGRPDLTAALLLAGWIAARAGWRIARLAGTDGVWEGSARRPDGGTVELSLGCGAHGAEPSGIHALVFHGGGEAVEIVEPVSEPDAARAFAAALRGFDEPSRGYEPALAALREGLARR